MFTTGLSTRTGKCCTQFVFFYSFVNFSILEIYNFCHRIIVDCKFVLVVVIIIYPVMQLYFSSHLIKFCSSTVIAIFSVQYAYKMFGLKINCN